LLKPALARVLEPDMSASAHAALESRFGGEWDAFCAHTLRAYGDLQSSHMLLTWESISLALFHDRRVRRTQSTAILFVERCGETWGLTAADYHRQPYHGLISPRALFALLFAQMVQKQSQWKTQAQALLDDVVQKACQGATTFEAGLIEVRLPAGQRLMLVVGAEGDLAGLPQLYDLAPTLRTMMACRVPTCSALLDILARAAPNHLASQTSLFWDGIGLQVCRAMLTKLADLFRLQVWRERAVRQAPAPILGVGVRPMRKNQQAPATVLQEIFRRFMRNGTFEWRPDTSDLHIRQQIKRGVCKGYMTMTRARFAGCKHLSFASDPGLHGREDTLGLVGFSPDVGLTAYGPTIVIRHVPLEECAGQLVLDLLEAGHSVQRRSAHSELVALHKALQTGFSFDLDDTRCSEDFVLRPLEAYEERQPLADGGHEVVDTRTGETRPEFPADADREPSRCTASVWADQGSIGAAGFNFLACSLGYFLCRFFDLNHRVWNDIKAAFKLTKAYHWRTIVYFTLVYNLNYNPFGKGSWFTKKRDTWEDWCKHVTVHDKRLRAYASRIAVEYNLRHHADPLFTPLPESPETDAEFGQILAMVKRLRCMQVVGPSAKLFRWWAWFQCHHDLYSGELWALKMMLEVHLDMEATVAEDDADHAGDARQDLNEMKRLYGNFKTAYKCISEETIWVASCMFYCVRPLWTINTERVQQARTPAAGLAYEVEMNAGGWSAELERLLDETLRSEVFFKNLDMFHAPAAHRVENAFDQVVCLYNYRVQTLRHYRDEPPRSLLGLLADTPAKVAEAAAAADLQYTTLLATERMDALHLLPRADNPLQLVQWRRHKPVRYLFMLIERGWLAKAQRLLRRLLAGLDEKMVEDRLGCRRVCFIYSSICFIYLFYLFCFICCRAGCRAGGGGRCRVALCSAPSGHPPAHAGA